jgi:hypothetical protein
MNWFDGWCFKVSVVLHFFLVVIDRRMINHYLALKWFQSSRSVSSLFNNILIFLILHGLQLPSLRIFLCPVRTISHDLMDCLWVVLRLRPMACFCKSVVNVLIKTNSHLGLNLSHFNVSSCFLSAIMPLSTTWHWDQIKRNWIEIHKFLVDD